MRWEEFIRACKQKVILAKKNVTIEPVVILFALSYGMTKVIRPNLLLDKACLVKLGFNHTICDNLENTVVTKNGKNFNAVQIAVSDYERTLNLATIAPRILFLLMTGTWSDTNGRRLLITIPILGKVRTVQLLIKEIKQTSTYKLPI